MKIQSLAIIFIIIVLPISIILSNYIQTRVETLSLQVQYDSKLNSATYDALKAYQLNSFNSGTSTGTYVDAKMRDIKASASTFMNSLATNFSGIGYTKEVLESYVPVVVYTLYDGLYLYSPYINTWTLDSEKNKLISDTPRLDITDDIKNGKIPTQESGTFNDDKNESIYGLKPYIYYSCRYKQGDSNDVVITYSLDNYVSIQGIVRGKPVSKYGYVLDVNVTDPTYYKGVRITAENLNDLQEKVVVDGELKGPYPCKKINGTKYYKDGRDVFSVINGKKSIQNIDNRNTNSDSTYYDKYAINFDEANDDRAIKYYEDAAKMRKYIEDNLSWVSTENIVDVNTTDAIDIDSDSKFEYTTVGKIFDYDNNIEAEDSNFNTHKRDVIKYAVERNLAIAISNYNNVSGATIEFQLPKLKETDWDKLMDNISIITFLQGMSIGGKVYSGYSIITNTKNEDVVMDSSIYIKTSDGVSHNVYEEGLEGKITPGTVGIFNTSLERKSQDVAGSLIYYYPIASTFSYDSIVSQNKVNEKSDTYFNGKGELARLYYTALGRERYSMYRKELKFSWLE